VESRAEVAPVDNPVLLASLLGQTEPLKLMALWPVPAVAVAVVTAALLRLAVMEAPADTVVAAEVAAVVRPQVVMAATAGKDLSVLPRSNRSDA
jgi:TPP-dependent indolepyruvate ferredoxin oxidoreductase alpha subunit